MLKVKGFNLSESVLIGGDKMTLIAGRVPLKTGICVMRLQHI